MEISIAIPTDSEGYYTLECPFCKDAFKLSASDYDVEETIELFCPYCGLVNDKNNFVSQKVIDHAMDLANNHLKDLINGTFKKTKRNMRNSNMRNSNMKMDYTPLKKEQPSEIIENDNELEELHLSCCNKFIKVNSTFDFDTIYCPYCGVN